MERQFWINWDGIIEEAKHRRKTQKLTQLQLAQLARISTPTLSRFENGDKDIQLSSLLKILGVLGLLDHRQLTFFHEKNRSLGEAVNADAQQAPSEKPYYDAKVNLLCFTGYDRGQPIYCAITREAMDDHLGAWGKDPLRIFMKYRAHIEHEARRKFLMNQIEHDGRVVLRSVDISLYA